MDRRDETGWIEVICGSMFSGKSEELIRRLRRAKIAKQKVIAFKPRIDDRYDEDDIVSHDERRIESIRVASAPEVLDYVDPDTQVVGIDEGQFLGDGLPEVCEQLANSGGYVSFPGVGQYGVLIGGGKFGRGVVYDNRFQKFAKGRSKGKEDTKSHYRKGVGGDWVNHLTEEHVAAFKERWGDLVLKLGYETDPDWSLPLDSQAVRG